MRIIKKTIAGLSIAVTTLYWAVAPVVAVGLCPDKASEGTDFSGLCSSKWTPEAILSTGINILLFVAFVAALGFLIFGGIRWILSGGDKEGTAKAKSTVTSALVGLVIVLASWILINVVTRLFGLGDISKFTLPTLPK